MVWKGQTPGVYETWAECEAQVKGFAGAQHKSFEAQWEAERAFHTAWYVMWHGRQPGLYQGWPACSEQITNFEGADYKVFENEEKAREAFLAKQEPAAGDETPKPIISIALTDFSRWTDPDPLPSIRKPILESICVDSACSGVPGPLEYQGVYTNTGERLFHQGPFKNGLNNIGEFLAIVHALVFLQREKLMWPIYSDSKTALSWVRAKKCNTTLVPDKFNQPLFDLIYQTEKWLNENAYENAVLKWDTENWGEIPADFGRK